METFSNGLVAYSLHELIVHSTNWKKINVGLSVAHVAYWSS